MNSGSNRDPGFSGRVGGSGQWQKSLEKLSSLPNLDEVMEGILASKVSPGTDRIYVQAMQEAPKYLAGQLALSAALSKRNVDYTAPHQLAEELKDYGDHMATMIGMLVAAGKMDHAKALGSVFGAENEKSLAR